MPDLTTEYFWICQQLADDVHIRHHNPDHENRGCEWFEFTHSEEPVIVDGERRCPLCGGPVTSIGVGV